ncbi:sugar transferase [Bdellovibrio bacteriovorus]
MKSFNPFLTSSSKVLFCLGDIALIALISLALEPLSSLPAVVSLGILAASLQYIFGNYELDSIRSLKQLLVRQGIAVILTIISAVSLEIALKALNIDLGIPQVVASLALFTLGSTLYKSVAITYFKKQSSLLNWLVLADDSTIERFKKEFTDLVSPEKLMFQNLGTTGLSAELLNRRWSKIVSTQHLQSAKSVNVIDFYETHLKKIPLYNIGNDYVESKNFKIQARPLKRLFDILISGFLLLIAAPVMALVAAIVKLESRGPAIYSQVRTGLNGTTFTIYKFRSMRLDAEKNGAQWASQNDNRVTKVGRFIRLTRLDELPQLWNVLKGEMSFVGPRPERPQFNEMLSTQLPYYDYRHNVKPGITGWAQVLYPYGASIEDAKEKLQFDLYYIRHCSLFLDLKIIFKTVAIILGARGR